MQFSTAHSAKEKSSLGLAYSHLLFRTDPIFAPNLANKTLITFFKSSLILNPENANVDQGIDC